MHYPVFNGVGSRERVADTHMGNGIKSGNVSRSNTAASNGNGNGTSGRDRISAYFPRKLSREIRALARARRWDLSTAVIVACEEFCRAARSELSTEAK